MADLLEHLIPPPASSHESFQPTPEMCHDTHTATSQAQHAAPPLQALPGLTPTSTTSTSDNSTIAALQAAGLTVSDVATYLQDPENARLLAETGSKKRKAASNQAADASPTKPTTTTTTTALPVPEPVQIGGPKTSHNVARLNHLCQERGLIPVFDFVEPTAQRFRATLRFGEHVVAFEEGAMFGSKKEAKEAVAARGLDIIADIPLPRAGGGAGISGPGGVKEREENWVGKLAGKRVSFFFINALHTAWLHIRRTQLDSGS